MWYSTQHMRDVTTIHKHSYREAQKRRGERSKGKQHESLQAPHRTPLRHSTTLDYWSQVQATIALQTITQQETSNTHHTVD